MVGDGDYRTHTNMHGGDVANGLIDNPEGTTRSTPLR
jgi:hypothetical protein